MYSKIPVLLATLVISLSASNRGSAQSTAFTYQGRLSQGGVSANGNFDFVFTLYTNVSAGGAIGNPETNTAIPVSNGLFTATLDFGNVFTGVSYWLEIGVRTNGSAGTFTTLAPRQQVNPAPYAITANNLTGAVAASQLTGSLPAGVLAGSYSNNLILSNPSNVFVGNGSGLSNLNVANLAGIVSPANGGLGFANTNLVPAGAAYDDGNGAFSSVWGGPVFAVSAVAGQTYFVFVPGDGASNDQGVVNPDFSSSTFGSGLITANSNILYLYDNDPNAVVGSSVWLVSTNVIATSRLAGTFYGNVDGSSKVPASTLTGSVTAAQLLGSANYPLRLTTKNGNTPILSYDVPPFQQANPFVDYELVVASPTPFSSSCGGFGFPMFSTNRIMHGMFGIPWSVLPNGSTNYLIDSLAGQINPVGEQYNGVGAINGGTWGLFEDPTFNFYMGGFTTIGGTHAADWFFDDWYTNGVLYFPMANPPIGNGDPRSNNFAFYAMKVNGSNGTVTVSNLAVNGSATLQPMNAFVGPTVSNGFSAEWNSNGFIFRRTSRIGATNWQDTLVASPP